MKKTNNTVAKKELRKKLILETKLKRELTRIFKAMSVVIYKSYISKLSLPNLEKLYDKTERAIHKHYVSVSKEFSTHYRDRHDVNSNVDIVIDQNIDKFIKTNVPIRANLINNTTQEQMQRAHISAISEILQGDGVLDKKKTALLTKRNFLKLVLARTGIIALSETQLPAEATKSIEALTIFNDDKKKEKVQKKQWVTVGDDKVREAHAQANGQIVRVEYPFLVGGENLFYPGDQNGSAWNVIGCRCTSVHFKR